MTLTRTKLYKVGYHEAAAYGHPSITLGLGWSDSHDYFPGTTQARFTWQTSLPDARPYGGNLEINLDDMDALMPLIAKARAKATTLAANIDNEMHGFIVGLRATGWKEAKIASPTVEERGYTTRIYAIG